MFKCFWKKKCTEETEGVITKVGYGEGVCGPRRLTVEFKAGNKTYTFRENVTVKSEAIKIGGIPIGQKKIECITEGIGGKVSVRYNPAKPKQAYLRNNTGKHT